MKIYQNCSINMLKHIIYIYSLITYLNNITDINKIFTKYLIFLNYNL
jgi:hypothetical protein